MVRIFSESVLPGSGRNARRRTHCDRLVWLGLAARVRLASLVRMEVSEFYYLVDCAVVAAANLFAIPQTNRRRTALLRSYTVAALDNVVIVFRSDCGSAFRNARSTTGFGEIRSAFPRPRPRRNRAIIRRPSPQRLSPVRDRFFSGSTGNVYANANPQTQMQYQC